MTLDYQIINLLHPHYVKGEGCMYDDLGWTVWIREKELCDEVLREVGVRVEASQKTSITEEIAIRLRRFFTNKRNLIGTFGNDYDRNILGIYDDVK